MKRTYRLAGSIALATGLSLLSACSILPKPEIVDVYRLPAAQAPMAVSQSTPVKWSLRLEKPMTTGALNSQNIVVVPEGNLISNYKGARWSDTVPVLLRNRLLEALQLDGCDPDCAPAELPLADLLRELTEDAVSRGVAQDNSVARDLFDTKLMGVLTPRPAGADRRRMRVQKGMDDDGR